MVRFITLKKEPSVLVPYQTIDPYTLFFANQIQDRFYSEEFFDELNEITTQIYYSICNFSPKIDNHRKVRIAPETTFIINTW